MKFTKKEQSDKAKIAEALVAQSGLTTPFLFMEECELTSSLDYFSRFLPAVRLFYAVKANPNPVLLRYFNKHGIGFDTASSNEVASALEAGAGGDNLVFSNPIKDTRSLHSLFRSKVSSFTFDNEAELEKIAKFKKQHGYTWQPKAILRIKIESMDVQIDLNEKFGASLKDAPQLIKRAADLGMEPAGVAFHVGTQSFRAENFETGLQSSMLIARVVKERYGIELNIINIGGGFPDPYLAAEHGVSLEALFKDIGVICQRGIEAGFTLYAEPGRFLVSAAGTLVTSVIGVSNRNGRRWVYLDDGVYGCYSGKIFDHKQFKFHSTDGTENNKVPCVVAGPTCDSIDIVEESALLPESVKMGDTFFTPNMGAYSVATACTFNGFLPAETVLVLQSGTDSVVVLRSGEELDEIEREAA